ELLHRSIDLNRVRWLIRHMAIDTRVDQRCAQLTSLFVILNSMTQQAPLSKLHEISLLSMHIVTGRTCHLSAEPKAFRPLEQPDLIAVHIRSQITSISLRWSILRELLSRPKGKWCASRLPRSRVT